MLPEWEIPTKHPRCMGCGHSEAIHASRTQTRARWGSAGGKGGLYRCYACTCKAFLTGAEVPVVS
jgi:hypothetical protein